MCHDSQIWKIISALLSTSHRTLIGDAKLAAGSSHAKSQATNLRLLFMDIMIQSTFLDISGDLDLM